MFDFDRTLISENSDTWVLQCLPQLRLKDKIHECRKQFDCWTDLMDYMLRVLHDNGCSEQQMLQWMKKIKLFPAMESFLKRSKERPSVDVIILSDANTVFINAILEECDGCLETVKEIHSNPAQFNSTGRLSVTRYHSHTCTTCKRTPNLCKGTVLNSILAKSSYDKVVYIGDGSNDVCPSLKLTENDHVLARKDYPLANKLQELSATLKPKLHVLEFHEKETEDVLCSLLST